MKTSHIFIYLFFVQSCIAFAENPSEPQKALNPPNATNQNIINQAIYYLRTCVASRQPGSWMYLVVPSDRENITTLITTAAANRLANGLLNEEEDILTEARLQELINRANQEGHNADNIGSDTAAFTHFTDELAYRAILHIILQQRNPNNADDQHLAMALARIADRHTPPPSPPDQLLNLDPELLGEIAPHLLDTEEEDSNSSPFSTQYPYAFLYLASLLIHSTL